MSAEVRLMAAGGWRLGLRPETRGRLLSEINMVSNPRAFGHLIVTPVWMPASVGEATLRAASIYMGVFRAQGDMARELSGPGMSIWMGDENDKGTLKTSATDSERTFVEWIDRVFNTLGLAGGLTMGDVEAITGDFGGVALNDIPVELDPLVTGRTILDEVCAEAGAEWRVNRDGTVDFGTPAFLWPTTDDPAEVLMRGGGLPVTSWGDQADADDYASGVAVPWGGDIDFAADDDPSPPYKRLDGDDIVMQRHFEPSRQKSTEGKAANQAAKQRALTDGIRTEISPSVDVYDLLSRVTPGDTVWAFEPDAGLVNYANQVPHRAEVIFPVAKRVYAVTQPFRQGMGKYLRLPDADGRIVDLTDAAVNEDGDCTLEVGAPRRTLSEVQRRGKAA